MSWKFQATSLEQTVFTFTCNWRGLYIMEHGNIPLLLWWIMLLSPKPSPESSRTLSDVVIGKNIIIRHPNQLLFSLSSFLDIFYKIYIKTRKKVRILPVFDPKKVRKKLLLGPKNVRKILIHRPEFHIFRLGSLHLVLSLNFAVLSVSRSFQLLNLLKFFAYLASEIVITSLLRIICW